MGDPMNTTDFARTADRLLKKLETANQTAAHATLTDGLRLAWNARGAADIAKLEAEIPNVWTTAEPAGALTRALRTLDR
jgi:hypothetical protein